MLKSCETGDMEAADMGTDPSCSPSQTPTKKKPSGKCKHSGQQPSAAANNSESEDKADKRERKRLAFQFSSVQVQEWLKPTKAKRIDVRKRPKLGEFSATVPPVVVNQQTIGEAIAHLSRSDARLASLIGRVGADALPLSGSIFRI